MILASLVTYQLNWLDAHGAKCCAFFSQHFHCMQELCNLIDAGRVVTSIEVIL